MNFSELKYKKNAHIFFYEHKMDQKVVQYNFDNFNLEVINKQNKSFLLYSILKGKPTSILNIFFRIQH